MIKFNVYKHRPSFKLCWVVVDVVISILLLPACMQAPAAIVDVVNRML